MILPGSSEARPTVNSHAQASSIACFPSWLTGCFGPTPTLDISTTRLVERSDISYAAVIGEDLEDTLPEVKGGLKIEAKDPAAYKERFAKVLFPTAMAPGQEWWCGVARKDIRNPNELHRLYMALDELLEAEP